MTDSDPKLDFSLPPRAPSPRANGSKGTTLLLAMVVLIGAANLSILLFRGNQGETPPSGTSGGGGASSGVSGVPGDRLSVDGQRELALKLEAQGLHEVAATAWTAYLASAAPEATDASAIWYRIGKLYQDSGSFDKALAAYYRCEALDPESALKGEIGRRAQESLESMGKFAALNQELASRVSMDGTGGAAGEEVIAEIGPRKITRAELDRQMEASIENQLARFAGRMADEQLKQQKANLLNQYSTDAQRMQFLQSFVVEEILYRKARETKLLENAAVREQLRDLERSLLAQQALAREINAKVNILETDLTTYYEANKARYVEPESATISQIVVADEELANALAEELKAADEATFAAKAREVSIDEATKERGGEIAVPVQKGGAAPEGVEAAVVDAVFAVGSEKLLPTAVETPLGYHLLFVRGRQPEVQRPFEEVREQVYRELRARKEQETEQQLMEQLRDDYNVVIHHSKFKTAEGAN